MNFPKTAFESVLLFWLTAVGAASAQMMPEPSGNNRPTPTGTAPQIPSLPAERFAACKGIADQAEREACIARQTAAGNPATKSLPEHGESASDKGKPATSTGTGD